MHRSGLVIPTCSASSVSSVSSVMGGTVVKRVVDILVSAALLVIALPVLLLVSIVIRCTSPGPVLFRQVRMGRGFEPFEIFKLRTMAHAQAGLAYTLGPDPRITPVGVWLRRTKLDELPQLWNVLRGDMSLVGPRPVLPELTYEFHEFYAFLLRVRPGLTDPASLKYCQETRLLAQADDPMHFFKTVVTPDKLRISFEYLANANLWTDCVTMMMTAVICCFPAMSRLYGELPEAQGERRGLVLALRSTPSDSIDTNRAIGVPGSAAVGNSAKDKIKTSSSVGNESVFSHDLAFLEAVAEDVPKFGGLPWILLPTSDFESRSAAMGAKGRASHL